MAFTGNAFTFGMDQRGIMNQLQVGDRVMINYGSVSLQVNCVLSEKEYKGRIDATLSENSSEH